MKKRTPKLTLGAGTIVNCASEKMARNLTADLVALGVTVEPVVVRKGERPAFRIGQRVEVHFERAVEVAFS